MFCFFSSVIELFCLCMFVFVLFGFLIVMIGVGVDFILFGVFDVMNFRNLCVNVL